MANADSNAVHKESLMNEINMLFAPPTAESYGKKGLIGIDEEDRSSTSSSQSTVVTETASTRSGRSGRNNIRRHDSSQSLNLLAGAALGQMLQPLKRAGCSVRALMNERTLGGSSSRSATWGESAYVADTEESELRALWTAIKYAQHQNPKEFELPKDLMPGLKLPGSYKPVAERKAKAIIELENGLIPKPIRRCYVCSRTCMFAPLLPCDFCTCCFHLDCLDPPMSQYPPRADRWMCPNHVEHVIDRYLVRSIRLTERLRLWSNLTNVFPESDQVSINTEAVHTETTFDADDTLKPESTDSMSNSSASFDNHLIDQGEKQSRMGLCETSTDLVIPYELTYGPDEEATILADLMRKVQRGRRERLDLFLSVANAMNLVEGDQAESYHVGSHLQGRALWRVTKALSSNVRTVWVDNSCTRIVVPPAVKAMYARGVRRLPRPNEVDRTTGRRKRIADSDEKSFVRGLLEFYLKPIDQQQQPIEVINAQVPVVDASKDESTKPVGSNLIDFISPQTGDHEVKSSDSLLTTLNQLKLLSKSNDEQRIHQLLDQTEVSNITPERNYSVHRKMNDTNQLRARAVFTPCGGTQGPTVSMRYRQFTVGTSPDCHLCLSEYSLISTESRCLFGSAHHATIFYDDWSQHFELINYSEHGTRVDGITYANDSTEKEAYTSKATSKVDRVRRLIRRESYEYGENIGPSGSLPKRLRMIAPFGQASHTEEICECTSLDFDESTSVLVNNTNHSASVDVSMAGWEGPAILRHGSVVQFGCFKFVMGLVNDVPIKPTCPLKRSVAKPLLAT